MTAMTVSVHAQKAKQNRYVKQYDVLKYLPEKSDNNPATFWKMITTYNGDFQNIMAKFNNPKGYAKKAKEKIDNAVSLMSISRNVLSSEEKEMNAGIRKMMFGEGDDYGMVFKVDVEKQELNAYVAPDGYATVNFSLVERLKKDPDMLCGVVAHEVCHYLYRHALVNEYKAVKKATENMIGAAIGAAGTAIGNAAAASAGVQSNYGPEQYTSWFDKAREQSDMARYRYSREQEAEADIVAYRFMEWIGADPTKYIEALRTIDPYDRNSNDKESDHPSTGFRIGMLQILKPAPWSSNY